MKIKKEFIYITAFILAFLTGVLQFRLPKLYIDKKMVCSEINWISEKAFKRILLYDYYVKNDNVLVSIESIARTTLDPKTSILALHYLKMSGKYTEEEFDKLIMSVLLENPYEKVRQEVRKAEIVWKKRSQSKSSF